MRLGILTGGGDCPGLNAVIRAVVLHGARRWGDEVLGFRDGWRGVVAVDAAHAGAFGRMVAVEAGGIGLVPLEDATAALKPIPAGLWEVAEACRS